MILSIALLLQAVPLPVPQRPVPDPGIIATSQKITPAGVQSVFNALLDGTGGGGSVAEVERMGVRLPEPRARWYGDPEFTAVPIDRLVSPGYGKQLRARIRDEFAEARALSAQGDLSHLSAAKQTYADIETTFGEPSETGLQAQLSSFWSSWHDIANDPTSDAPRSAWRPARKDRGSPQTCLPSTRNCFTGSIRVTNPFGWRS